jgi:DoxX-like protein
VVYEDVSRRGNMEAAKGKAVWTGRVISILPSLLFVMSSFMKVKGGPEVMAGMAHLGLPESLVRPLAILEISCVLVYWIPATSVLGAILLTGYIGGAICTHLRVGDPFFMQAGLGVFVWLGLYLREPRLRDLIPLRRLSRAGDSA